MTLYQALVKIWLWYYRQRVINRWISTIVPYEKGESKFEFHICLLQLVCNNFTVGRNSSALLRTSSKQCQENILVHEGFKVMWKEHYWRACMVSLPFSILLFVSMISTVSHHCLGGSFVTITLKEIFVNSLIICFSLCVYIYSQGCKTWVSAPCRYLLSLHKDSECW